MKIELRMFNVSRYNDILNNVKNNIDFYMDFNKAELLIYDGKYTLEELSEPLNSSEKIEIDVSDDDLSFSSNMMRWKENFNVGKMLHKKLQVHSGKYLGIFYEPGFWAYLCHLPVFRKYIKNRYLSGLAEDEDDEESANEDIVKKIVRFFLCKGTSTRTGVMFNWMLTDCLYDNKKNYDLVEIGFSFIDSVKAIYERSFHKNKLIVKAFVQGIENNYRSPAFKDTKNNFRSIIPTHISNIAALNCLDSYDNYYELVNKITSEQKHIIDFYKTNI